MSQVKSVLHKFAVHSTRLVGTATLLATLAFVPTVSAQVTISINPPVCSYGYYDYAPYGCAPVGYYGPGYFHNGIFLGVGPWASWGYGHGWGEYRFRGAGGGRYVAGHRDTGYHGDHRGHARSVSANHHSEPQGRPSTTHSHASASHGRPSPSHAGAKHGNESHGGGEHH